MITILGISLILQAHDVFYHQKNSRLHTCLAFCLIFIRNVLNIKCSVYCKLVLSYFVFIKELFNIYLTNLL